MNPIKIYPCREEHLSDLLSLWNNPQVMHYVGFPNGLETTLEKMRQWYQNLRQSENTEEYVIYHDELGFCGETYYSIKDHQAIMDIKLLPHAWGHSIASYALSYALVQAFQADPLCTAVVDPHNDNHSAHHLYQSLGFTRCNQQESDTHTNYELQWRQFKPQQQLLASLLEIKASTPSDFTRMWEIGYRDESYPWQATNGPYFNHAKPIDFETFIKDKSQKILEDNTVKGIYFLNQYIGCVSYYYESEKTRWLEMGIVIEDDHYWSKGISTLVLKQWISYLFNHLDIDRVGFATWSGNPGMIRVGQKCAMKQEAQLRHVRYYQDYYYDSIKFGMTRNEFKAMQEIETSCIFLKDSQQKYKLCDHLLHANPDAFGIESSILDYCHDIQSMTVIAFKDQGLIALNHHPHGVLEIHVLAVDPQRKRTGIGRLLVQAAIFHARTLGAHTLTVKTLADTHPSITYQEARQFYIALGFKPFEVIATLWGEENPCLIMIQTI